MNLPTPLPAQPHPPLALPPVCLGWNIVGIGLLGLATEGQEQEGLKRVDSACLGRAFWFLNLWEFLFCFVFLEFTKQVFIYVNSRSNNFQSL